MTMTSKGLTELAQLLLGNQNENLDRTIKSFVRAFETSGARLSDVKQLSCAVRKQLECVDTSPRAVTVLDELSEDAEQATKTCTASVAALGFEERFEEKYRRERETFTDEIERQKADFEKMLKDQVAGMET